MGGDPNHLLPLSVSGLVTTVIISGELSLFSWREEPVKFNCRGSSAHTAPKYSLQALLCLIQRPAKTIFQNESLTSKELNLYRQKTGTCFYFYFFSLIKSHKVIYTYDLELGKYKGYMVRSPSRACPRLPTKADSVTSFLVSKLLLNCSVLIQLKSYFTGLPVPPLVKLRHNLRMA